MTIIGGTGSLFGSLLGAGFIVIVGDALASIWPRWELLLGLLLVAVVIFVQGGLWVGIDKLINLFNKRQRSVSQSTAVEAPNE